MTASAKEESDQHAVYMDTIIDQDPTLTPNQPSSAWASQNLASKLRNTPTQPPIYTGEDGMEEEESLDLSNLVDPLRVPEGDLNFLVIDFSIVEC